MNMVLGISWALFLSSGLVKAQAPSTTTQPPAWRGTPPPGDRPTYISCNTKVAQQFQGGYFDLAYILGPIQADNDLHLLRRGSHVVFEREGQGWRYLRSTPLPAPPGLPKAQKNQDSDEARQAQNAFDLGLAFNQIGYQVDEAGTIYWVDVHGISRHTDQGWETCWAFPKDLLDIRMSNQGFVHLFLMTSQRWAVVGGKNGFLEILEISKSAADPSQPATAKQIHLVPYADIGECAETMAHLRSVPYCVVQGFAYFYAGFTGRMFRFNLESGSLTELSSTWASFTRGTQPSAPRRWQNTSGVTPPYPVMPDRFAFAPRPDGSVHARALMMNQSPAVISSFDLSSEGSSLQPLTLLEDEMPDPLVLPDSRGELVSIRQLVAKEKDQAKPRESSLPIKPNSVAPSNGGVKEQ